jgi:hypothetical protein
MLDRAQQLRVRAPEPRQRLRIDAVALALRLRDQPDPTGIRNDHFVTLPLQQSRQPRRVRAHLEHDPRVGIAPEPRPDGIGRRAHAILALDTPAHVEHAQPAVAVAHIQSDGHPATNRGSLAHGQSP